MVADKQGVEGLGAGPADHHEVVRLDGFDLEPEGAALTRHVRALHVFGNDSLEPALKAGLEQLDAILFDMVGHEDVTAGLDRLAQTRTPA